MIEHTESAILEVPPSFTTRVEATKAAADNGYRLIREINEGWQQFASTTAPGNIFIAHTMTEPRWWLLSLQHQGVAREFGPSVWSGPATATFAFPTLTALHEAIGRTYRLSVSLPQLPLEAFREQTSALPRQTEAERVVIMRVGQNIFRDALMEYWNGTCPLTGITDPTLLRASHIVPWAECENDSLRLDVYNGLLLSSLWDAAFDSGLISFTEHGVPLVSSALSVCAAAALKLSEGPILRGLATPHEQNLSRHRAKYLPPGNQVLQTRRL